MRRYVVSYPLSQSGELIAASDAQTSYVAQQLFNMFKILQQQRFAL